MLEYLTERREIYRALTLRERVVTLDGTLPRAQVLDAAGEIHPEPCRRRER